MASASARPLTKTALDRGGFLCRALLVLEAAHHRGPASSKRDAHLGAIDAACAFDAKTWRPPDADQNAKKIVVAIHHNGLGNQLFQYAMGRLLAWSLGSDFAAVLVRAGQESEIPNFKGSYLGRFSLVSANFWTSDHLLERSRSVDVFFVTRARETLKLKRR